MELRAFEPMYGPVAGTNQSSLQPSTTLAATAAAAPTTQFSGQLDGNTQLQIQIANQSSAWAFVNFGRFGAVTAATVAASYPVAPGAVVVVTVAAEVSGASVILATGNGNVTFTRGSGL